MQPHGPSSLGSVVPPKVGVGGGAGRGGVEGNRASDDPDAAELRVLQSGEASSASQTPQQMEAWRVLVGRYQHRLFALCYRMVLAGKAGIPGTGAGSSSGSARARELAADLTQDAFLKVMQGLHTFDGSSKLSTWMYRVTVNVCLSHGRSARLRQMASLDAPVGGMVGQGGAEQDNHQTLAKLLASREQNARQSIEHDSGGHGEGKSRSALVAAALQQLEDQPRAMLLLRDVHGLEYEQIASVMEIPVGTVKSRLFRARLALRQALESQGLGESRRSDE
jgi:RNA polymerase sigma-70 factor, ECF subfamily